MKALSINSGSVELLVLQAYALKSEDKPDTVPMTAAS
jgi:hypothetical protein